MKKSLILAKILPVILLTAMVAVITALRFPRELEIIAEDELYQNPSVIPSNIKIIAIDEKTLEKLGRYSDWDRTYFAELVERLNSVPDAKPRVIGIDVILSGTDFSEGDKRLAEAVKNAGNVVLASKLETSSRAVRSEDGSYSVQTFISDEITAYDDLSSAAESGFTNIILDSDGFVRRTYTLVQDGGQTYKSFAYLIAQKACDNPETLEKLPQIAELRYTGKPEEFETIPMSAVLSGEVPARYFADSIVLVGAHEEGMMDSYKVPIDRSAEMYGVECHANAINSFLTNRLMKSADLWVDVLIAAVFAAAFAVIMSRCRLLTGILAMTGIAVGYPAAALGFFHLTTIRLAVIYIPLGVVAEFLVLVLVRYVELQKKRADEMQKMLFSMADSMAEAIEGRTPYNANHTKNVAKRCLEMLEYINKLHKEGKSELHFSKKDKNQLYLAAMLHDIGKMDVPLEVMDKPTKLGNLEEPLRARLEIITLRLKNDIFTGNCDKADAEAKIAQIAQFLDKLGLYNCGKPLSDEDWAVIDKMSESVYTTENGEEIPFLTRDESDDLHIKAGTLSDNERKIMQSHVVYTDAILGHIDFGEEFDKVHEMAANHHELLNSKGYPKGIGAEKLDVMTRILTIMDIYDSLIADDRPYKKAKPIKVAFNILDEEAEFGKIDKKLLEIAKEIWLEP